MNQRHIPSCPPLCPKCGKFNCDRMMSFNGRPAVQAEQESCREGVGAVQGLSLSPVPAPLKELEPEPLADRILAHIADFEKVKPSAHKHLSLFNSYETLAILFDQIGRAHVDISKRGGGVKGMSIDERVSSLLDKVSALSPQPPTSEGQELRLKAFGVTAGSPEQPNQKKLQLLVNDLYVLFTSSPSEIAARFGESRCIDDSSRINYALEWLADVVSEEPEGSPHPPSEERK